MRDRIDIAEAASPDAADVAEIHLSARREAMPYLRLAHTQEETRAWFARDAGDRPAAWWVARWEGRIVGYMLVHGEDLDHLYVRPGWQRRGIGRALLAKAKALSPQRLVLWTFQRNAAARAFYEAHGFRAVGCSDGRNEEGEPDVQYAWDGAPISPGSARDEC
jgi:ribosomal protein S18 acetylase RimI-like enzyme